MKTLLSICVTALLLVAITPNAKARESVSIDVFYDNLDPYGSWLEVGDYGYVWQPRDVDPDWRPYSDGHWVYTDAGWTWNSDEPYGWAVYHYGRWANVNDVGWVWVPGTEWGPAWVSWRHSPKYVGWAPLPPEAEFREDTGFSEWVDDYYDIGPENYRFVEVRNLGAPRLRTVFVNRSENINIIQQTTNITHITYQNNMVFNGGIRYDEVSRFSAEPIRRLKLERREQFDGDPRRLSGDGLRSRIEGNSLSVIAVPFMHSSVAPRTVGRRVERVEVNHGWRNAGPASEIAAVRAKLKSETKAPASLPPRPRFERPMSRDGNADARRTGDRTSDGIDPSGNARMRGDDIARRQGSPSATERRPNGNEPPTALSDGTRPDRNRNPGQPPETSSRDGRGRMNDGTRPRTSDEAEGASARRPGGARPEINNRDGDGKMTPPSAPRSAEDAKGTSPRPAGTPPGPQDRTDNNKKGTQTPTTRSAEGAEGTSGRPGATPPESQDRAGNSRKGTQPPTARPTEGTDRASRRPEGTPPGSQDRTGNSTMKETPRGRTTDEPQTNTPRRPGGAPADIPGREGQAKPNDPQRPRTGDNAESSSVRKPGARNPADRPDSAPKSTEPSTRKGDAEPPKARGAGQPGRADGDEASKPRSAPPQARESRGAAESPAGKPKAAAEPQSREPKKSEAERPGSRAQASPNTNSQQERGRGNSEGKEKKKSDDNAR
ncbi:MAG: hypothetical protein JWO89_427 [Verrucomicrobiaceae bacterium]|nr:hypothetical protein [Verrucomicrobiaceae bacterium]